MSPFKQKIFEIFSKVGTYNEIVETDKVYYIYFTHTIHEKLNDTEIISCKIGRGNSHYNMRVTYMLIYSKEFKTLRYKRMNYSLRYIKNKFIPQDTETVTFTVTKNNKVYLNNNKQYLSLKNMRVMDNIFINDYSSLDISTYDPIHKELRRHLLTSVVDIDKPGFKVLKDTLDKVTNLPLDTKNVRESNSFQEAVTKQYGDQVSIKFMRHIGIDLFDPKTYSKLRVDDFISAMDALIPENKLPKLYQLTYDHFRIENKNNRVINASVGEFGRFIIKLFKDRFKNEVSPVRHKSVDVIAYDYVDYCYNTLSSINLDIGLRRMNELHDDWVYELNRSQAESMPEFKACIAYMNIFNSTEDITFDYVDNKTRLCEEGNAMKHCVASYGARINNSSSGIYSILYGGDRYTLEVGNRQYEKRPIVYKSQLRGKYNACPPDYLEEYIDKQIDIFNDDKDKLEIFAKELANHKPIRNMKTVSTEIDFNYEEPVAVDNIDYELNF
jgi:hypothetical protein